MLLTNDPKQNINTVKQAIDNVYSPEQVKSTIPYVAVIKELTLAQAILESRLLKTPSKLASQYNNLFGIKGKGLTGKTVNLQTKEVIKGKVVQVNANFAVNDSLEDSIRHHKNLLERPRYASVLSAETFQEAAHNIVKCGYCTDPAYAKKLIDIYKKHIVS